MALVFKLAQSLVSDARLGYKVNGGHSDTHILAATHVYKHKHTHVHENARKHICVHPLAFSSEIQLKRNNKEHTDLHAHARTYT